jgi:hypothetical protein
MEFEEMESAVVHNWTEDFTADIHDHDASPFVGVRKIAFFWNGDALALVPSIKVSGAIEELANIMVDPQLHSPPEGLVRFWWDAIEPWSFAWLELVDCLVDFTKRDWVINFHQLLSLGDQVEDAKVDWSMITEHTFKVWAEDSHVVAAAGPKRSIGELHRHVDRFLVMRRLAAREDADLFPRKPWVHSHVVDVRADIAIPARFGKENHVFHLFCHAFQTTIHRNEPATSMEWTFCPKVCTSLFFSSMIGGSSVWLPYLLIVLFDHSVKKNTSAHSLNFEAFYLTS